MRSLPQTAAEGGFMNERRVWESFITGECVWNLKHLEIPVYPPMMTPRLFLAGGLVC